MLLHHNLILKLFNFSTQLFNFPTTFGIYDTWDDSTAAIGGIAMDAPPLSPQSSVLSPG